jgi:hypothetical protein
MGRVYYALTSQLLEKSVYEGIYSFMQKKKKIGQIPAVSDVLN